VFAPGWAVIAQELNILNLNDQIKAQAYEQVKVDQIRKAITVLENEVRFGSHQAHPLPSPVPKTMHLCERTLRAQGGG